MAGRLSLRVSLFIAFAGITGCGGSSNSTPATSSGSSSSSSGAADSPNGAQAFLVSTQSTTGGTLSPANATVPAHDFAVFSVSAQAGYSVETVAGCGGSLTEGLYKTGTITANCTVSATFTAQSSTAQLSGRLSAGPGLAVDADTNDLLAGSDDNSTPSLAQAIHHLARIQGFASAIATGGSPEKERFATIPDTDDYYQAVLEAGQIIQLQVVDFIGHSNGSDFEGELDLYLFDQDLSLVGVADNQAEYDSIVIAEAGEYFVNVHAHAGTSKYVLQLLPASTGALAGTSASSLPEFVPNEMLIKYKDEPVTTSASKTAPASGRPPHAGKSAQRRGIDVAQLAPGRAMQALKNQNPATYDKIMTLRSIKAMRERAEVEYAEPNFIRHGRTVPNDPYYYVQWHYESISLPEAWDVTTGTEHEVYVAVIDTGVLLNHPDFAGQLSTGYDFISNAERARDGDGIDDNPNDPGDSDTEGDSSWHGTHVAGTIAAATDNGVGVAGVSWGARIMPLRALGKDGGTSYDIMQAVRYAAGLENDSNTLPARRADIINMSLGGYYSSNAERDTFQAARDAGVILVAAAGNDAASSLMYPASYASVISVSATDYADKPTYYSNFGTRISLAAPGGDTLADLNRDGFLDGVLSAFGNDSGPEMKYGYSFGAGTSMAAPHVAGVLALMKSVFPALSPDAVDALLQTGDLTDDLGPAGWDENYGYGRLNALKAVETAVELASNGTELNESPAHVVADPGQIDLGFQASASFTVNNLGGGNPSVAQYHSDLTGVTIIPDEIDANGLGAYRVSLDRMGMNGGHYTGEITFTLEDETIVRIPLEFQVELATSAGQLPHAYILLLDAATREVVRQVNVDGGSAYADFTFDQVSPGTYFVVSGSDIDANQITCSTGETCGGYPSLLQPDAIKVDGTNISGINLAKEILDSADSVPSVLLSH